MTPADFRELAQKSAWPQEKKLAFIEYQDYLVATGKAENTQKLYSRHIYNLGEYLPKKPFADYTETDMQKYKTTLSGKYAPYNVHNQILDTITFLKWHLKLDGAKPECMKWYKVLEQRKKVVRKLRPQDVLTPEDLLALVSSAGSRRNKALVFCLWETGCRIQEFLDIEVDDLQITEKVISIWINRGKTRESERQVFVIQAAPSLLDWFAEHEYKKNKNARLFYSIRKGHHGEKLYARTVSSILERAATKSGITKPVNPHALRKSRATFMAKKGYGDQLMREMFGWSANSPMPSYYSSLAGDSVKMALMADAGIIKKETFGEELAPIVCPFCKTTSPPDATICKNPVCSRPVTIEGIQEERDKQIRTIEDLVQQKVDDAIAPLLMQKMDKARKLKEKMPITKG